MRHLLHGLVVDAPFPLDHDRPTDLPPDLVVSVGPPVDVPSGPPDGQLLVSDDSDGTPLFAAFARRPEGGYLLRFQAVAEMTLDPSLTRLTVQLDPRAPDGILSVLLTGSVVAFVLSLRGHTVLHASAVEVGGKALAFTGHRGMGKSTCATLACAAGALLITDDVLRVDLEGSLARVRLGGTHSRLRKSANELLSAFSDDIPTTTTADERTALLPPVSTTDGLPLAGLVVPQPDRDATVTSLHQLSPRGALMALVAFPRLVGWQDPVSLAAQFDQLASIVERVPVLVATIPWGPPFRFRSLDPLFDELGLPRPGQSVGTAPAANRASSTAVASRASE